MMPIKRTPLQVGFIIAMIICSQSILTKTTDALHLLVNEESQPQGQRWTHGLRRTQTGLLGENDKSNDDDQVKAKRAEMEYLKRTPVQTMWTCKCDENTLRLYPAIWRLYIETGCVVPVCSLDFRLR